MSSPQREQRPRGVLRSLLLSAIGGPQAVVLTAHLAMSSPMMVPMRTAVGQSQSGSAGWGSPQ